MIQKINTKQNKTERKNLLNKIIKNPNNMYNFNKRQKIPFLR